MQLQPSVLLYSQALVLISQLENLYKSGLINTIDEFSSQLDSIINRFQAGLGGPMFVLDPFIEYEPPLSTKINDQRRTIKHDVTILQNQMDISRAASIMSYNFFVTEVKQAAEEVAKLNNKVKILQLYSDTIDNNMITFGDGFGSDDFIDTDLVNSEESVFINESGFVTLGIAGSAVDLTDNISCKILDSSNGISGNNQELVDLTSRNNTTIPDNNERARIVHTFVAELGNPNNIANIYDENPSTYFEYERYSVKTEDRERAENLNFRYKKDDGRFSFYDWAQSPPDNVLKLDLEFDLKTVKTVNVVKLTSYGLKMNRNTPIKINFIETSDNGSDWIRVNPQKVWIATALNLKAARIAKNVSAHSFIWTFTARQARYIRVHIEQPNPIDVRIGHLFYVQKERVNGHIRNKRVRGPVPPYNDPNRYLTASPEVLNDMSQRREVFSGKRWAIGIRDIAIQQIQYKTESTLVTKLLPIGGLVDRVALECDLDIPDSFDKNEDWIEFYLSPDDGISWYQISRIQDDYLNIPEVLAFNDPTPAEFRDPNVFYVQTSNAVDSLRLKIVLRRPTNQSIDTPVIKSYKLKVRRR